MKPVCLVLGAGAGIGGTVAAKFANEGYHAHLCRRTDQEGLDKLIQGIEDSGGSASGSLINAIEEDVLEESYRHGYESIRHAKNTKSVTRGSLFGLGLVIAIKFIWFSDDN